MNVVTRRSHPTLKLHRVVPSVVICFFSTNHHMTIIADSYIQRENDYF